jgi:alpha-tubulin suppressor-like RCC1 family protein
MVNRSIAALFRLGAAAALSVLGTTALLQVTDAAPAAGANSGAAPATTASSSDPLYAWGTNYYGQLGDGTNSGPETCDGIACSTTPVQVSLPSGVTATAIAGGSSDGYALGSKGTVYAWGEGGELGDGTTTDSSTPVVVSLPSGVTATAIAAGFYDGYAIGSDGKLYAWGDNTYGALGNGTTTSSSTPVVVSLPSGVTPTAINGGSYNAFAIGSNGKLYAWGENIFGSLGNGTTTSSSTPVVVSLPSGVTAKAIAGGVTAYAIGSDGNLYAWGNNNEGQLGDGTSTGPQMCQDIEPPTPCSTIPVKVSLPSGVAPTAIAGDATAFAIGSNGKLYAWGDNVFGLSLGNGSTTGPDTCVNGNPCSTTPVQVSLPSGVTPTAIGAGAADGYAIGSDGNLYAWGDDSVGELGDGTTTGSSTPVVVSLPPGSTPEELSTEPDSESAYTIGTNVSVLIPSPGATLSGSTYLDASASNATSVEFRLFGGTYGFSAPVICTATLTDYGWLCAWNTRTVPDGAYVLVAVAFNSTGSTFSSGVSVTVDNPLPTTRVLFPRPGATLSGSTYLDASASNATSLKFLLFGGTYGFSAPVICTAKPTRFGWLCAWNTTTVPDGSYVLVSEAFNSAGSAFSSGVGITVDN